MYNRQELCLYLINNGFACYSTSYNDSSFLDDVDNNVLIEFVLNINVSQEINISLNGKEVRATMSTLDGKIINLPNPLLGKRLSFMGYVKNVLKKSEHSLLQEPNALEDWYNTYKYGYTYANFRKQVLNNNDVHYSINIEHNLTDISTVHQAFCKSLELNFLANGLKLYVSYAGKTTLLSLLDFFSCDKLEDLLSHYTEISTIASYRRKLIIDGLDE